MNIIKSYIVNNAAASGGGSGGGLGDVVGPSGATDDEIVLFNGATGKLIKSSGTTFTSLAATVNAKLSGSLTQGSIWQGDGSNVATPLAIGTPQQELRVNTGGTALEYFSPTQNPMVAVGDIIQSADVSGTPARLAAVATGNVLISGGVATLSSWGKVGLTTHVSGTLPIANGGTNLTSLGTADQLLGVNNGATALEYKSNVTLTAAGNFALTGSVTTSALHSFAHTRTYTFSTGTNTNEIISIKPVLQYTGGTSTLYGIIIDPTNTNTTGLTFYPLLTVEGNVGIGTLVPTAKLQVRGDGTSSGVTMRIQNSTPGTLMFVQDDGVTSFAFPNGRTTAIDHFTLASGTFTPSSGTAAARGLVVTAIYGQTGTATGDLTQGIFSSTHSSVLTATLGGNFTALRVTTSSAWAQSGGSKYFKVFDIDPRYNQTSGATGAKYVLHYHPTIDAELGVHYFLVSEPVNALTGLAIAAPTALLHLGAGTTVRASMRLAAGVAPTSPNDGDLWYEDTSDRLMFRKAASVEILCASAVTTEALVTDTTLTISYLGATYKIMARA